MNAQETTVWAAVYAAVIASAAYPSMAWDELRRRAKVEAYEALTEYRRMAP